MTMEQDIDALLAEHVAPDGPGAAIAVIRDGAFVCRKAYGLADLEWGTPLSPDCVFRIASLTKQFTATAVMILEERGALSVDDPVERWLPDWPVRGREVTLRHLLNHTSGIWRHDSGELPDRTRRPNLEPAEILKMIAERGFEFEPGARYRYNNSGYLLLGAIIERASGRPYAEFLREAIFAPLGMTRTAPLTPEAVTPLRAHGYVRGRTGFHNARPDAHNWSHAAGGLGSTLDDLAHWDAAVRAGRLVRADTLERMLEDTPLADGSTFPYGFGWGTASWRGARIFHHTGGVSGFGCHMAHLRDEALTTIVLSNLYLFPFDPVTRGLIRIAKGWAYDPPFRARPTAAHWAAFAGRYEGQDGPMVFNERSTQLAIAEDTLCEANDPEIEYRFSEPERGVFQRVDYVSPLWPDVTFRRAASG
ncbi:MAG TPA: serine hydrolase domain-containing protein [Caulobacteraceae bacterium]|nr:serine hydrolase domain-containing protein [Caulobacteraceae bacterium]